MTVARPYFTLITDERIEAAITAAGVPPEWCEWHGDPEKRITFRVEPWMGRYAEHVLTPYMDDDALAFWIGRTADRLAPDA